MDNPFADLIPQQEQQQQAAPQQQAQSNPFADLIPEKPVARETSAPQEKLSPFMSAVTGFNTGVERMAHGVLQPLTESGLFGDRVSQASKNVAANREANFKIAEESNPLTANAAQLVGNIAPTMLVPGGAFANLSRAAATGAGIGAAQYVDPGQSRLANTIWGGIGGSAGYGLGKAGDSLYRYGNKVYAQSAIPGLVERATESLKKHVTPEKSVQILQNRFNKASQKNEQNWEQTNEWANVLDTELKMRGHSFNGARFIQDINKGIEKIDKLEPAKRARYKDAIGFANYIKEQTPQSFSGAVLLRQNLNKELNKYMNENNIKFSDREMKDLIFNLKGILDKTVKDSSQYVNKTRLKKFKNDWASANKSHQELQNFYLSPNAEGRLFPLKKREQTLRQDSVDPGILGKYFSSNLKGAAGIDQLRKITGNDNAARSYVMRNVIEGRGTPNEALNVYEKLSTPQREALFARTPYGEQLKAANYARSNLGEAPSEGWRWAGHHIGAMGLPGLAGFLGAKTVGGQDWDASLAAGLGTAALAKGGQAMVARSASPASVMRATNRAMGTNKNAGRYLSPVLANLFATLEAK